MSAGKLGVLLSYAHMLLPDGAEWAMDNGCFGTRYPYPGDDIYLERMEQLAHLADSCRFITAPDVVCDPVGTLEKSLPMLPRIRDAGFPVAFVAQDGIENMDTPWGEFDILFLGGSTEWKLGPGAAEMAARSLDRGIPVHMGRVNTRRRLRWAKTLGCSSADGTFLRFSPDRNLPQLLRFLWQVNNQPPELW